MILYFWERLDLINLIDLINFFILISGISLTA